MGTHVIDAAASLRRLLRTPTRAADEQWRQWARALMEPGTLTVPLLTDLWREACDFDDVLARYVEKPLTVPDGTVIVAGSGKETFKTINVSTAASILAAAAGGRVVKGVSRSVSAVSGAADVLDALGVSPVAAPDDVADAVHEQGIAFVPYAAFCPSYARRYDGVFPWLSPVSFLMPIAVLGVLAEGFVYGLAHPDVELAAAAISHARPDLPGGAVVATMLGPGEFMDERAPFGISMTAHVRLGEVQCHRRAAGPPPPGWRDAVAQRGSHAANAAALAYSLAPCGGNQSTALVDLNAAVILQLGQPHLPAAEALRMVEQARLDGAARRLLRRLKDRAMRVTP